jgi:asparagine synthetase B (glutamine-hydrolysing)
MSTKLERIVWIDAQILCDKYPNCQKVVEQFGVERRVAFLDRRFMIDHLGAPMKYNRKQDGWYYTDPNYSIFKVATEKMEVIKALKEHIFDLQRRIEFLETENRELRRTVGILAQKVRA